MYTVAYIENEKLQPQPLNCVIWKLEHISSLISLLQGQASGAACSLLCSCKVRGFKATRASFGTIVHFANMTNTALQEIQYLDGHQYPEAKIWRSATNFGHPNGACKSTQSGTRSRLFATFHCEDPFLADSRIWPRCRQLDCALPHPEESDAFLENSNRSRWIIPAPGLHRRRWTCIPGSHWCAATAVVLVHEHIDRHLRSQYRCCPCGCSCELCFTRHT